MIKVELDPETNEASTYQPRANLSPPYLQVSIQQEEALRRLGTIAITGSVFDVIQSTDFGNDIQSSYQNISNALERSGFTVQLHQ